MNDFLIGREHWERIENALKISSDAVSRSHTRIAYNPSLDNENFVSTLKNNIYVNSKRSSKWRRISTELLNKIA